MSPSRPGRYSFRRALAISVALHLCAALFVVTGALPLGGGTARSGGRALETTRIAYLTIERRARPAPHPARRARLAHAAAQPMPPAVAARPAVSAQPTRKRPQQASVASVPGEARSMVRRSAPPLAQTSLRPQRLAPSLVVRHDSGTFATPSPAPSATPAPAPAPSASASPPAAKAGTSEQLAARGLEVPPGGWGQSFERPLVADESALESLRSRYHASAPVRVEVDDSGRAVRVSLPAGIPDDVRAELERRLLELRYVPAECNGLRCTGTLSILL